MKKSFNARSGNGSAPVLLAAAPATIGFRMDDVSSQELAEQAARLNVSPHELARHYVMEMLSASQDRAELWEFLKHIDERMIHLREDLVLVAEGILVATHAMSKQDARAWVDKCFP